MCSKTRFHGPVLPIKFSLQKLGSFAFRKFLKSYLKISYHIISYHRMIILTSNLEKIREIKEINPTLKIEIGPDLEEVLADKDTVIIYKSLAAGEGYVVEDTILEIDGKEIVDIKWKLKSLKEGMKLKWIISFGYHTGTHIKVYRGEVDGIITIPTIFPENAFGFDLYFKPLGMNKTLYELQKEGLKNQFSPRALAIKALLLDTPIIIKDINTIKQWTGNYQNENSIEYN